MFVRGMYACVCILTNECYLCVCVRVCVCTRVQADEELSLPVYARDKQARQGGGGGRR